jgi:kynureninase
MQPATLEECLALDRAEPLRGLRELFDLPKGVIYLDGNSLGALPKSTPQRIADAVSRQWGEGLIRSWNDEGWFELPRRVGDRIARVVGAKSGEVIAVDGTSINLYKVLSAALGLVAARHPGRKPVVLSDITNFPTDLYIAEGICRTHDAQLRLVEPGELDVAINSKIDVLLLTHVDYRTGAMYDMAKFTALAHASGALAIWDLAHSAGAVPVDLHAADADFAIGCGYKYLNGGPGSPGFVWVNPRHIDHADQPLSGWWGHSSPFAFNPKYEPAGGIARFQCGSQPILSLLALDEGVNTLLKSERVGGMSALRAKSLALTDLFMGEVRRRLEKFGFGIVTPSDPRQRGSQVSLTRTEGAFEIIQALIARGVIGDFRAGDGALRPDILRFGFTPLYIGFEEVWRAVDHLEEIMHRQEWRQPRFAARRAVT